MSIFTNKSSSEMEKDIYAVSPIPERLRKNQKIALITADKTEDLEFFYPYYRFTEAGYEVDVITPEGNKFEAKHGLGLKSSKSIEEVFVKDYVFLYIPGGKAPEELKNNQKALDFVREFVRTGKPVGSICHGPQVLAEADVIAGKKIAAWPECEKEIKEAGAHYSNEALAVDGQFITSRWPGDLHRNMQYIIGFLDGALKNRLEAGMPSKEMEVS